MWASLWAWPQPQRPVPKNPLGWAAGPALGWLWLEGSVLGSEGCNSPTRARFAMIQEAKFIYSTSLRGPGGQVVQVLHGRTPAASWAGPNCHI